MLSLPLAVVEDRDSVLPPSLIATILSLQHARHQIVHLSLLVLFLVCTVTLGWLDTQGRLDAGERGNAKEDDGDEHENGEK